MIKTLAAVAYKPEKPLVVESVDLDGRKEPEVLAKIAASSICHTDAYTLQALILKVCFHQF